MRPVTDTNLIQSSYFFYKTYTIYDTGIFDNYHKYFI